MKILTTLLLLSIFLVTTWSAMAQSAPMDDRAPMERLIELGILDEKDDWGRAYTPGAKFNGEEIAKVLSTAVSKFGYEPTSTDDAIDLLVRQRILTSPDYWRENAIPGGVCSGAQVRFLFQTLSTRIKE